MSFEDLGLSPEVLRAITEVGYTTPTPIQEQAIPYVLMGRDVLGCAQTGTGKTASFTLPMIDILAAGRARARMPRSLIIEPTRELAAQVGEAFEVYGKYHKLEKALLIGGESFSDQERKLDRGVDVLIATPGRLIDLYEHGKILLSDVKILVIDEADRMLDMGFIPDVERIVGLLSKIRQTLFFSATMPPEIRRLADAFLMNPKEITVTPPTSAAATVTQGISIVAPDGKRDALRRLLRNEDVKNAIIFCNRKRDVDILFRSLTKYGFDAAALHGDLPQSKRTETLERFRNGEVKLLVASDVAARGLDVQGMSHVFNFDVPIHAEDYIHRIGRTGRAGREGRAFTLATPEDGRFVEAIQQLIGKPIPVVPVPGVEAQEFSADEAPQRGRGRGGQRGRRGGSKPSRSAEHAPVAKNPEPAPRPVAPQPVAAAPEPAAAPPRERHRHEPRERFAPITMKPGGEIASNVTPLPRRDEPHRHEADDDRRVVGFGDHMPAFLGRTRATRPA
jgi:superfamily II DNA/RNA helicase